jgi:hypothetical protein
MSIARLTPQSCRKFDEIDIKTLDMIYAICYTKEVERNPRKRKPPLAERL